MRVGPVSDTLTVIVFGQPRTKGSLTAIPGPKCHCCDKCNAHLPNRGRVKESVRGSSSWRALVAREARERMNGRPPIDGPVSVYCYFILSVDDVTVKGAGDTDKLERNVLDALTDAGVYHDDAQVVTLKSRKVSHRETNLSPGVVISINTLPVLSSGD